MAAGCRTLPSPGKDARPGRIDFTRQAPGRPGLVSPSCPKARTQALRVLQLKLTAASNFLKWLNRGCGRGGKVFYLMCWFRVTVRVTGDGWGYGTLGHWGTTENGTTDDGTTGPKSLTAERRPRNNIQHPTSNGGTTGPRTTDHGRRDQGTMGLWDQKVQQRNVRLAPNVGLATTSNAHHPTSNGGTM